MPTEEGSLEEAQAQINISWGDRWFQQKKFDDAWEAYTRAKLIYDRFPFLTNTQGLIVARLYERFGDILANRQDIALASECYQNAIEFYAMHGRNTELDPIWSKLSELYLRQRNSAIPPSVGKGAIFEKGNHKILTRPAHVQEAGRTENRHLNTIYLSLDTRSLSLIFIYVLFLSLTVASATALCVRQRHV